LGNKIKSKFIAILITLLIISSSLLITSGSILLQEKESPTKVETLFSILKESNNTVLALFSRLEKDGYNIPQEGILLYNQALSLANESKNLFQVGNYPEAEAKIIESLNKFEEALSRTYAITDDPNNQRLTLQEKSNQIKSSIDRYNELVRKFNNLTKLAAKAGFNTTIIQNKIQEIISLLIKASNNLEISRFEITLRNIAEIKVLADQVNIVLKDFAEQLKTNRLETYIEKTEIRLDIIKRTTVSLASNYPTSTIDAALSAIESAKSSLNNAKYYLQINQLSDTLIELADSKESEDQAINYLKSEDSTIDSSLSNESSQINIP
jgi:hypothetical protein